jgi:hypothetical protein
MVFDWESLALRTLGWRVHGGQQFPIYINIKKPYNLCGLRFEPCSCSYDGH